MIKIGTVARRTGLRSSAIRYYEAHGLLRSQRLPNGYRVYGEEAISALRFLRRAQGFGITLKEIKQLIELSSRGQQPCTRVRELARHHLQEVELKLQELRSLRRELRSLLNRPLRPRLGGEVCPIIERTGNSTERGGGVLARTARNSDRRRGSRYARIESRSRR
jgi:DNA-binding transcriptional MerR regulator